MDMLFVNVYLPADAFVQSVLIPRPALTNFAVFPHPHAHSFFPGCICCSLLSTENLPASLLTKGYLYALIYTSHPSCVYNRKKFAAIWIFGTEPSGKQVRWTRRICIITSPDTSRASIRICLHPLLLIIPQTPHNGGWVRGKGSAMGKSCLCEEWLSYLVSASFLSY